MLSLHLKIILKCLFFPVSV